VIPAFVNNAAGTSTAAKNALAQAGGFEIIDVAPQDLEASIGAVAESQPERIVIAGGDGTLATAARALCDTNIAIAVIPGGTLNHFARDHDIPTDLTRAAEVALDGKVTQADTASVNNRLFLNTSSVGAYVAYVRARNRVERWVGYRIASLVAAIQILFFMRPVTLEIDLDGKQTRYDTPLAFIGVGERETRSPTFGSRVRGGSNCLHVIVVRERRAARLLVVALDAATRGLEHVARTPEVDSFLTDSCVIRMRGKRHHITLDGEIVTASMPLEYRLARNSLRIVVPADSDSERVA
jgi:diacylglycerol kinase family enzyme